MVNYELGSLLIKVGLACFFLKQNFSVKIRGGVGFMRHLEILLLFAFGAGKIMKVMFVWDRNSGKNLVTKTHSYN